LKRGLGYHLHLRSDRWRRGGLSASVARLFAREGMQVALARSARAGQLGMAAKLLDIIDKSV
jgi:hypothetical protein